MWFPSLKQNYKYDPEQHSAPPVRIQWMTRTGSLSMPRWIFIQCCGQTEKVRSDENGRIITSLRPCKEMHHGLAVTNRHHSGKLILMRTTKNQVRTRTPPLVQWNCCKAIIPTWNDAWDSRDRKIDFRYVDSGCRIGQYTERDVNSDSEDDYDVEGIIPNVALVARPIVRRPKTPSQRTRPSGPSSGEETIVLAKSKVMDPHSIKFTQNSCERTFSNGASLLETMKEIFAGTQHVGDFPEIRVATPSNIVAMDPFFTCDNRRLLLFKVLRIDEVHVTWIKWTSEFDGKLRQNVRFDPESRVNLNDEGVDAFRKELIMKIFEDDGESCLYIPSACAGYVIGTGGRTIKKKRKKYAISIRIYDLPDDHPVPEFTDVVVITFVERTITKFKSARARKEIRRMVSKVLQRPRIPISSTLRKLSDEFSLQKQLEEMDTKLLGEHRSISSILQKELEEMDTKLLGEHRRSKKII